jgi:formamidopyrimidine-DNA glycosylase
MPELPEVETIRRGLEKKITNKRIIKIQVNLPRLIKKPKEHGFTARLKGTFVKNIKRRGKYIIFLLNSTDYLVVHLGMSGLLLYHKYILTLPKINEKHNHIILCFEDRSEMIYNDVRQFGKIWLLKKDEKLSGIESLGFEPLEHHFTFNKFYQLLQSSKGNIKSLLMNQKKIAGIGNIYANEILFHAGIYPLRKVSSLTKDEARSVYFYIREILSKAIKFRGTTMLDESYRDSQGMKGQYRKLIMVYGKKGGICPFCGQPLEVIRIENRSSFVCPICQK